MERIKPVRLNENYSEIIGDLVTFPYDNERKHHVFYYLVDSERNASLGLNCTRCKTANPTLVKYEDDHLGNTYWDAYCDNCSPKGIVDAVKKQVYIKKYDEYCSEEINRLSNLITALESKTEGIHRPDSTVNAAKARIKQLEENVQKESSKIAVQRYPNYKGIYKESNWTDKRTEQVRQSIATAQRIRGLSGVEKDNAWESLPADFRHAILVYMPDTSVVLLEAESTEDHSFLATYMVDGVLGTHMSSAYMFSTNSILQVDNFDQIPPWQTRKGASGEVLIDVPVKVASEKGLVDTSARSLRIFGPECTPVIAL